jgi:hypothetical protein
MFEKFTSLNEVHNEVYSICLLKYVVHTDDERMVNLKQNKFLNRKALYRLMLNHNVFSYAFHGVKSFFLPLPDKVHLTECTMPNYA